MKRYESLAERVAKLSDVEQGFLDPVVVQMAMGEMYRNWQEANKKRETQR